MDVPQSPKSHGCRVVAISGTIVEKKSEDGEITVYSDGDTLLEITIEALEIQRRVLDLAFRARGLLSFEKHDHNIAHWSN